MRRKMQTNYTKWINSSFLEENEIIFNLSETEKNERFSGYLEFGTGGMRGIMGLGTNRMNKYIIRKATQGLSNYLIKTCGEIGKNKGVVISFDCRNNSSDFALETALVLCANGIGFGLPPLEAMGCGCEEVYVSNTSCLPEIFEDSVIYINPNKVEKIFDKKITVDKEKIKKVLGKYSWKESSQLLIERINL